MKLVKFALISLACAWFAAACSDAGKTPIASDAPGAALPKATATPVAANDEWAEARQRFTQFCANCHKPDGAGGEVSFSEGDKPLKVPTLKEGKFAEKSDAEYVKQITDGGEGMPAYKKRLTDDKIAQLVAFIRKEFQGKDVKLPPAKPGPESKSTATSSVAQ